MRPALYRPPSIARTSIEAPPGTPRREPDPIETRGYIARLSTDNPFLAADRGEKTSSRDLSASPPPAATVPDLRKSVSAPTAGYARSPIKGQPQGLTELLESESPASNAPASSNAHATPPAPTTPSVPRSSSVKAASPAPSPSMPPTGSTPQQACTDLRRLLSTMKDAWADPELFSRSLALAYSRIDELERATNGATSVAEAPSSSSDHQRLLDQITAISAERDKLSERLAAVTRKPPPQAGEAREITDLRDRLKLLETRLVQADTEAQKARSDAEALKQSLKLVEAQLQQQQQLRKDTLEEITKLKAQNASDKLRFEHEDIEQRSKDLEEKLARSVSRRAALEQALEEERSEREKALFKLKETYEQSMEKLKAEYEGKLTAVRSLLQ